MYPTQSSIEPLETDLLVDSRTSIQHYQKAIAADPTTLANYWLLGLALLLENQESEAQLIWTSSLSQKGVHEQQNAITELIKFLARQAEQYETSCAWETAWLIRCSICKLHPHDLNNLLAMVRLSIHLKRFENEGRQSLSSLTQHFFAQDYLASINLNLLKETLQELAAADPFHELFEICFCNNSELRQNVAFDQLRNQVALVHNSLGIVFHQQGLLDQAIREFEKCLKMHSSLSPNHLSKIYLNLGLTFAQKNDIQQAGDYFQKVLGLDPNNSEASKRLLKIKYQLHNLDKKYTFTSDWFSWNIPVWQSYLQPFVGQPHLRFLEIGSWEGRSTCWLLENILTHPTAKITCVDTFEGSFEHQAYDPEYIKSLEDRFDFNIKQSGFSEKVEKIVGSSHNVLRSLPIKFYDLIYIDGSHLACDVLMDALLSWQLVKVQGILVFDDYDFKFPNNPNQNTKIGIDGFVASFMPKIQIVHQGYQLIVRKIAE